MAAPAPAPGAPPHVRGVLNVRGRLVTVVEVRARLGAPSRAPRPSDRLLLLSGGERLVALEVDEVLDVRELGDAALARGEEVPRSPLLAGALRLDEGVVLVHAPEAWLAAGAVVEAR